MTYEFVPNALVRPEVTVSNNGPVMTAVGCRNDDRWGR